MYPVQPLCDGKNALPKMDYLIGFARWVYVVARKIIFQSTLIGVLEQDIVNLTELEAPEDANDMSTRPFGMDSFQSLPLVVVVCFFATVTTVAFKDKGVRSRVMGVSAACMVLAGWILLASVRLLLTKRRG